MQNSGEYMNDSINFIREYGMELTKVLTSLHFSGSFNPMNKIVIKKGRKHEHRNL